MIHPPPTQPLESWSGPRGVIQFHRDDFEMVESRVLVAPRRRGVPVYSSDAIVEDVRWCGHAYTGVLWFYRDPPRAVPSTQTKQLFIGFACTSHNQHANISPICVQIPVVRNCGIASREMYVKSYFTVSAKHSKTTEIHDILQKPQKTLPVWNQPDISCKEVIIAILIPTNL